MNNEDNIRILIVDDNPSIHEDFKKLLSPETTGLDEHLESLESSLFSKEASSEKTKQMNTQFILESAFQGEEAIEKVRKSVEENNPYAMIFMDVRMPPGIDGIVATSKIWEVDENCEVVICSAYSDYTWEEIIENLNPTDKLLFIRKPYDAMEVQQLALSLTNKWNLARKTRDLITDLEDEIDARLSEIESQRAKAVESSKLAALGEMAAGIAHEINNPLAIIKLSANALIAGVKRLDGVDAEKIGKIEKKAEGIESTVMRIAKIVQGLRDFSRNGDGDPFERADLVSIIEGTFDICTARFKSGGVDLILEPHEVEIEAEVREVQISQILLNFISNSYDAVAGLEEKWVRAKVEDAGDSVQIVISDSGTGIPEEIREKILQPFFTTKEIGRGTGLGLSISKGIIEDHGGSLIIDSESPNTCFVIELPKTHPKSDAA